jgi:hypothetical protein
MSQGAAADDASRSGGLSALVLALTPEIARLPRRTGLGVPLICNEEFEVVVMIAVADRRDTWVTASHTLSQYELGTRTDTAGLRAGSGVTGGRSADFVASAYQSALVTDITHSGVHHHSGVGWSSVQEVPVLQQSPPGLIANAAPVPRAPLERTVEVAVRCAGKRMLLSNSTR